MKKKTLAAIACMAGAVGAPHAVEQRHEVFRGGGAGDAWLPESPSLGGGLG